MIDYFVKKPITTSIFILFFVLLGVVSYFNLNVEENPKVDFPIITIKVVYPGATPEEIETQVIKKIENAVSEVSEIKKLTSKAYEGFGYIMTEFLLEADANIKSIEVKDKVDAIINDLPRDIKKPTIEKFDPLAKPVVDLILSSNGHTLVQLHEFADKFLKNKFSTIEGVAKVEVLGGRERQINVDLDPILMKEHFVTIDQVISTISRKNLNIPSGQLETRDNGYGIRFLGEYKSIKDISETVVLTPEGREVKLHQIALINDSKRKVESIFRHNQKEVVGLRIINVSDGNALKIAKEVQKRLPQINKNLATGMSIKIASDYTKVIEEETIDTEQSILIGISLTIIILLIFTASIKATIISAIVIPSSIISSFFLMDFSAFTINTMTLLAIATSLGTLIANAIVIIESTLKYINKGVDSTTAAISGTNDVKAPILASVGTNLVVFTPIAFMEGIAGKFLLQFGMTVVFATIFSMIASFTLTPMLCAALLKPKKEGHESGTFQKLSDSMISLILIEYEKLFKVMFKFPKTTLLLIAAIFFGGISFAPYLGNEFTPKYDKNQVLISLKLPENSLIKETEHVVKKVEKLALAIPEVVSVVSNIGENGVQNASISLELTDKNVRFKKDTDIIQELVPKLSLIPDVVFDLNRGAEKGMGAKEVTVNVYGRDYDQLISNVNKMKKIMESSGYFLSVESSYRIPGYELHFTPDQNKMSLYNIPNYLVATTLRSSVYGDNSNIFKENGEEYDINIKLRDQYIDFLTDINNIMVMSRKGMIPISKLGRISIEKATPMIERRDKSRIIVLGGNLIKSTSGKVQQKLDKEFAKINFPKGSGYYHAGSNEHKVETEAEMSKAFILAAILTIMVLAALLNSLIHPFTIATSILTSMSGVIVSMFLLDQSMNIAAMLAMVMLVGLVVNNSIILIDEINTYLTKGKKIVDAIWHAVHSRFKMILMTSLAIILGTMPQLFSTMGLKASMGAVIIGGMIASIFFTFFLTPILFWYFERLRRLLKRTTNY